MIWIGLNVKGCGNLVRKDLNDEYYRKLTALPVLRRESKLNM